MVAWIIRYDIERMFLVTGGHVGIFPHTVLGHKQFQADEAIVAGLQALTEHLGARLSKDKATSTLSIHADKETDSIEFKYLV